MELSLEQVHRVCASEFVLKCRQEYDSLLSAAPDIPDKAIKDFNKAYPTKVVRPDVCNGLNVISHEIVEIPPDEIRVCNAPLNP
jgi:hypothetical protein